MAASELKQNIHALVGQIQDDQMLKSLYDFLKHNQSQKEGQLWQSLSEKQKQLVLKSFEESKNEGNLIPMEQVFNSEQ